MISCENKDLCPTCRNIDDQPLRLVINWRVGQVKPVQGMRANLFSLNDMPSYGIDQVSCDGDILYLPLQSKVKTFCYSYQGNNIYFRNETDINQLEAYTSQTTRATYSKSFPDEKTYAEPLGPFYAGTNESFEVTPSTVPLVLNVWVENLIKTYTFEVRNVKGTRFISSTRGAIAGMSNSIFLETMALSPSVSTLLFNATANTSENKIEGSFQTFGHQSFASNIFTIEILYPSATGGILQKSWDVSSQVNIPGNYHIIIDDADIDIPDGGSSGSTDSGFEVDVNEWENETVILN
ncbi:DUF5119 domain-containing protein [Dysgonomonas alginatilytica]|nr:DUF5119 domain-containing protein [Dysgonomonas alginatilytica]